ncbi:MSMEG_6728 family protein [Pseudactinotalea suaedae]|uniref:MSMEG_6728 family protein n=1 Tax=Pseudactinotalea suaedae TaxID=1524924 RepID=UPI0012E151B9|nr:MSMEG_6728 family protein [Pseudactinotalea suaedae]
MQTFLPYPSFEESAQALDDKRLGKQRVEAIQVIRGLVVPGYGWRHHPAVKMWAGHLEALGRYGLTCCEVWLARGYADTCAATIAADVASAGVTTIRSEAELVAAGALPWWLGIEEFHRRHRSRLLANDPAHYGVLFTEPTDLEYWWPPAEPDPDTIPR